MILRENSYSNLFLGFSDSFLHFLLLICSHLFHEDHVHLWHIITTLFFLTIQTSETLNLHFLIPFFSGMLIFVHLNAICTKNNPGGINHSISVSIFFLVLLLLLLSCSYTHHSECSVFFLLSHIFIWNFFF